jgi:nitrite reductase/ring-hydroxylating ferredoxin subunit
VEHPLIAVDDIPDEGTTIVYFVDGAPRATANVCTHLGGPLEACGREFACTWHGATFDIATGTRRSGPARSNTKLMHLPTRIVDGQLVYVWHERAGDDAAATDAL